MRRFVLRVVALQLSMPPETLEFEEPIAAVLREIDALNQLPRTDALDRQIETLRRKVQTRARRALCRR